MSDNTVRKSFLETSFGGEIPDDFAPSEVPGKEEIFLASPDPKLVGTPREPDN